jgi:hypothetical protein
MSLQFNSDKARKADRNSSFIRETGKYCGVITRAEKLLSSKGTQGVGLSFKADDGATANYLDIYTTKANGDELWGSNIIQSMLGVLKLKNVDEGPIKFKKWDKSVNEEVDTTATGYPALIGKRIGLVLQRELSTNSNTGADVDRVNLVRVFDAQTGMTSTEIADGKTKAAAIDEFVKGLKPVYDKRVAEKKPLTLDERNPPPADFDDDINF